MCLSGPDILSHSWLLRQLGLGVVVLKCSSLACLGRLVLQVGSNSSCFLFLFGAEQWEAFLGSAVVGCAV